MKIILFLVWTFFILCACTEKNPNAFILEGSINGLEGEKIYLLYYSDYSDYSIGVNQRIDTAVVTKGRFQFRGEIKTPMTMGALLVGDMFGQNRNCQLFLEPTEMKAVIDFEKFNEAKITGSLAHAEWDSLMQRKSFLTAQIMKIYERVAVETDEIKRNALKEEVRPLEQERGNLIPNFIETHPNSLVSPYLLILEMGRMPYEKIKAAYDNFSDRVRKFGNVKKIEDELMTLARVQPGLPAPEISARDVNGHEVRLSMLKGKYVILDFWASWCVPCGQSFPHVKELYEKYHQKGLEVFCVADNDDSEDAWKKAIEKDGVEMFIHVLRGRKNDQRMQKPDYSGDISKAYAVHFLPTKYLIDNEGKIVGKFGDVTLDIKLKEIFGE